MESLGLCSPVAGWMVKTIRWPWTPISELQLAIGGGELGIRLCPGTISVILGIKLECFGDDGHGAEISIYE